MKKLLLSCLLLTSLVAHGMGIFQACKEGDLELVKAFIQRDATVVNTSKADTGITPLYIAAENGHTEIVQLLLQHHANKDLHLISGFTPLLIAARNGHTDVVQTLLDNGADKEAADRTYA